MVQQHVCELYQAVGPGLPVLGLLRCLPKLCTKGLQQAGLGSGSWAGSVNMVIFLQPHTLTH